MRIRMLSVVSILLLVCLLAGCGAGAGSSSDASVLSANVAEAGAMPTVVNTAEYTLYQNIFQNKLKSEYSGKPAEKEGTFATLYDAFNDVTRYYVWGYNDRTKCCDWQWELKIDDVTDLPTNGSLITVSGTYEENDDALDKFWIIHPQITVKEAFAARVYDIDMQSMDNTLERVQSINIANKKDFFEGKTVCAYGRIQDAVTLEDPYYDNSWTIGISGDYEVPAFGTLVLITGTVQDGQIVDCTITPNTQY